MQALPDGGTGQARPLRWSPTARWRHSGRRGPVPSWRRDARADGLGSRPCRAVECAHQRPCLLAASPCNHPCLQAAAWPRLLRRLVLH